MKKLIRSRRDVTDFQDLFATDVGNDNYVSVIKFRFNGILINIIFKDDEHACFLANFDNIWC